MELNTQSRCKLRWRHTHIHTHTHTYTHAHTHTHIHTHPQHVYLKHILTHGVVHAGRAHGGELMSAAPFFITAAGPGGDKRGGHREREKENGRR